MLATTAPSWGRRRLETLGVHSKTGRGKCTADEHLLGGNALDQSGAWGKVPYWLTALPPLHPIVLYQM
jgi:hypothetical protein